MTRPTTPRTRRKAAIEPDTSPAIHIRQIAGIDLSPTSTGVCIWRHFPPDPPDLQQIAVHTIARNPLPKDSTLQTRANRNKDIAVDLLDYHVNLSPADLLIMEGPALGISRATGAYMWDRAGLWWLIIHMAIEVGVPIVTVAPTTRAMWATGSGKADKGAVAAAMTRRLPDITFANSDEADAAALAYIGAQRIGWRPVATKNEQERLEVITWPKGVHA